MTSTKTKKELAFELVDCTTNPEMLQKVLDLFPKSFTVDELCKMTAEIWEKNLTEEELKACVYLYKEYPDLANKAMIVHNKVRDMITKLIQHLV